MIHQLEIAYHMESSCYYNVTVCWSSLVWFAKPIATRNNPILETYAIYIYTYTYENHTISVNDVTIAGEY